MNAVRPLFALSSVLLVVGCSSTRHQSGGNAVVEFVQPERFSDIKLRDTPPERAREVLLPDLEAFIQKQAQRYLSAGHQLTMRITDIDDAGWIWPVGASPKRTVRPSQPARIDFEYSLVDASGNSLSQGKQTLTDLPWDRSKIPFDQEDLPLIKQMLRDWIRKVGRTGSG